MFFALVLNYYLKKTWKNMEKTNEMGYLSLNIANPSYFHMAEKRINMFDICLMFVDGFMESIFCKSKKFCYCNKNIK